jgi:hypothetical protein
MQHSENMREVFRAHHEEQRKYTYFLLAAAGASIAFAVSQTQEALVFWSQLPLGLAVMCWGGSFLAGCRHLAYVSSNLYANMELLKAEGGIHQEVGSHPERMMAASEGIRAAIKINDAAAVFWGKSQFTMLVVGAALYLAWHILEMILRTTTT